MARFLTPLIALGLFLATHSPAQAIKIELEFDKDELVKNAKEALQDGQLEKARDMYLEALTRRYLSKSNTIQAHSDLCVTYMFLEEFALAIEQCEAAIHIKPNRWESHNNLGTVFLLQGDYQNALKVYKKALKMKPGSEVLKTNMDLAIKRAREAGIRETDRESPALSENPKNDFGFSAGS